MESFYGGMIEELAEHIPHIHHPPKSPKSTPLQV